ncbi:MAG: cupin domain-containing protein [Acidobacteriia bacterium]|nr:cupin domain-containing protein [Terriglobia bacterium]
MDIKIHKWMDIKEEQLTPLLTRQMVSTDKQTIALVRLKKGCVVPEHHHEPEQVTSIIDGALEFTIDNRTIVLRKGESMIIPANVPHAARALEDTLDLDIFSSVRWDWVNGTDDYIRSGNR